MSKQTINIGASPNDGTGTPLRTSFDYTNQNFTEIYTALGGGVALPGATTQVIFNDGGTNLAGDAGLVYNKTTDALTVAGLVTAGSATITGDLTVDTNVLKVDTTNNRVGIGTATPTVPLEVAGAATITGNLTVDGNTLIVTASTDTVCIGATSTDAKFRVIDASGNGVRIGFSPGVLNYNLYDATVHEFRAVNGSNSFGAITANGIGLGVTPSASGIGVTFPATQSASSDANCLDDYEEGTFTATLIGGTTNPTIPVTTTARYTKVGRLVTVQIEFINVSTVGASGTIGISGLPFVNGSRASTGIATLYNLATFTGSPVVFLDSTTATLAFYGLVSNSIYSSVTHNAGVSGYSTTTITYSV